MISMARCAAVTAMTPPRHASDSPRGQCKGPPTFGVEMMDVQQRARIHETLCAVWNREISADEGLEVMEEIADWNDSRLRARNAALWSDLQNCVDVIKFYIQRSRQPGEGINAHYERIAEEFYLNTGMLAPGKDAPPEMYRDEEETRREWEKFCAEPITKARETIAKLNETSNA